MGEVATVELFSCYYLCQVILQCGNKSEIVSVTEPKHCEYELTFSTPLTCHNESMLVYPTLSESHRRLWDQLFTELKQEQITTKVCAG